MKKFISLLILQAFLVSALESQDIFQALEKKAQWELADAYWQVADKFDALGQKERAKEFRIEAKSIFPSYPEKPGLTPIPDSQIPVAVPDAQVVDPLTGIPDRLSVRQRNLNGEKIVRLQFSKMIRGFLNEDLKLILSAISGALSLGGEKTVSYQDILLTAPDFFLTVDGGSYSPETLFKLETLRVTPVPDTEDDWILSVETQNQETLNILPFWKAKQFYKFVRVGDLWKLNRIDYQD